MAEAWRRLFAGDVVAKSVARDAAFRHLPRYVTEYLVAKFAPGGSRADVERLREFVRRHCPTTAEQEWARERLRKVGRVVLVAELRVWVQPESGLLCGCVPALGEATLAVPFDIAERVPRVFYGAWGTLDIRASERGALQVADFVPIEPAHASFDRYLWGRSRLSAADWIVLLLESFDIPAATCTEEERLLWLVRLAPLVERRLHLIELVTERRRNHLVLDHLSPDAYRVSEASHSAASFFPRFLHHSPGLVHAYAAVVVENVDSLPPGYDRFAQELRQYFTGGNGVASRFSASLVLRVPVTKEPRAGEAAVTLKWNWPAWLRSEGWTNGCAALLPPLHLPRGPRAWQYEDAGLGVDYLAAMFARLRRQNFPCDVTEYVDSSLPEADYWAAQQVTAALLKLVYPGRDWSEDAVARFAELAVTLRTALYSDAVPQLGGHASTPAAPQPVAGNDENIAVSNPAPSVP